MLEDEPGYELHLPKEAAESLRNLVNDDFVVDKVKQLLETGVSYGTEAAGINAEVADVFARIIGNLFEMNADKFKRELDSNMGSDGVILTIKPSQKWVIKTSGELSVKFDLTDPVGSSDYNAKALIEFVFSKAGATEAVKAGKDLRMKFRQLLWASETPATVLIDSSVWSIKPRPVQ